MPPSSEYDPIPTSSPRPPFSARPRDSQDRVSSSPPYDGATYPNTVDNYVTQPTQIISAKPPARISDIVIPQTSPERPAQQPQRNRFDGAHKFSSIQQNVFNRMAPPGTYPNVPAFSNSQRNPILVDSDDEKGIVTDSDDDLLPNRADIPSVRTIMQPSPAQAPQRRWPQLESTSFISNKWGLNPVVKGPAIHDAANLAKVKSMQVIFPDKSEEDIIAALRKYKWNKDDAVDSFFADADADTSQPKKSFVDLTSPVQNRAKGVASSAQAPIRRQNFHQQDNKQSIAQKYKHIQSRPSAATSKTQSHTSSEPSQSQSQQPVPTKKRKLVQGRKEGSVEIEVEEIERPTKRKLVKGRRKEPSPEIEEIIAFQQPKQKIKLARDLSDDSDDSDVRIEVEDEQEDLKLLAFLNDCDVQQLMDLTSSKPEDAAFVISKRPFGTLANLRELQSDQPPLKNSKGRAARRKPVGDKILDAAEKMWRGLGAIDSLVKRCNELNNEVKAGMEELGLRMRDNQLDATKFETDSRTDSGVGSPNLVAAKHLKKPAIMSDDMQLKSHQVVGFNWLNLLYSKKLSAILADDMGLGKTCQVITFLSHLAETGTRGPHLIIVPGSTLENWIREFSRFSPSISVYPFHGSQAERYEMQHDIADGEHDVILTTYDIATKPEDNKFFRKLKPLTIVFDEGHMLKNKQSNRFKQLIRIPTNWRLLLTGTPLQNNLLELISILHFLMPAMFTEESSDLDYIFKHKAKTTDQEHSALLSVQRVSKAKQMMAPFVLRRKKEHIDSELPPKTRRIEYCEMTDQQAQVYAEYTEIHQEALRNREAGVVSIPQNYLMDRRKAAIHPLLFRYFYSNDDLRQMHKKVPREKGPYRGWSALKMEEEMSWWSDFKIHQLCLETPALSKYALQKQECMDSGKVTAVLKLLKQFDKEGSRALLFSQFTMVLDILESVFNSADIKFCRLDGSTPIAARQDWIDRFHEDESYKVFMLSTKSGGTGINLACANKVIIFDASFNPQDDMQAENRAHRFGQSRPVEVIRLISRGTVEEQIHTLCEGKLALEGAVTGDEAELQTRGIEMVEQLLAAQGQEALLGEVPRALSDTSSLTEGDVDVKDAKDAFLQGLRGAGLNVDA